MPTYGYQCTQCGHEFSVFQSMKDDPITICPECEGTVKRLLYPVGVVFKGSGWYINDSRKPEKAEGGEEKKTSETKSSDSGSESKPASSNNGSAETKKEAAPASAESSK